VNDAARWVVENQRDLAAALDRVRRLLVRHAERDPAGPPAASSPDSGAADASKEPFAVASICRLFGLSAFERDVVLLCAGVEMDARFPALIAAAQGDPSRRAPTFGLALAALPDAHWSALTPAAPLRAFRIVETAGPGVTSSALRLDERILHALAGIDQLDERLAGIVEPLATVDPLGAGPAAVAERLGAQLASGPGAQIVQLSGGDSETRAAVAARAARALGATGLRLRAGDLPAAADERFTLARLLARESLLSRAVTVLDAAVDGDGPRIAAFAEALASPLVICAPDPLPVLIGKGPAFVLPAASRGDRLGLWRETLGPLAESLDGSLEAVCAQFDLAPSAIRVAAAGVRESAVDGTPAATATALWEACRGAARPRLEGLARRIDARASWGDLVLPEPQKRTLLDIAIHVRQRHRVYEEWGFAARGPRGLGISALFSGASGTGKTMAAEVLARDLRLDLFRIDLAGVVSKYIGETEKNLKRLFDAAEGSGAILLFDEADALFGKRSEVKDSHDRYANIEISYLLQRMEEYRGLAILTTNLKSALDPAFLRRIRFVVPFPFPDADQRAAIWRGIFPAETPTSGVDAARLAQLSVAGGHIRNIALAGAFLAADRGERVGMRHLAEAARAEYTKLERPLSDAETRGWA
jgi:hypothetical protein